MSELLQLGFREFECFINTECELHPAFTAKMKSLVDSAGGQIVSVHPFTSICEGLMLFSEYPRRTQDGIDFYRRYFEAAQTLGAGIVVMHGAKIPYPVEVERYCERFAKLNEAAQEYGVTVAQENVNGYKSAHPDFLCDMRRILGDRVKFVLDIKQSVRAGHTPYEIAEAMGGQIIHVHANDHRPGQDCLLPGQGEMDYQRLAQMLTAHGYQGHWMIEVYRKNFGCSRELTQAAKYLDQALHQ
ncbi:MAG: sugar phosphate isomerase/epimerase [Clostridiales bacterium]|nr:sugar phosphate isomerase/epimerase [Clostridiales bacterium]